MTYKTTILSNIGNAQLSNGMRVGSVHDRSVKPRDYKIDVVYFIKQAALRNNRKDCPGVSIMFLSVAKYTLVNWLQFQCSNTIKSISSKRKSSRHDVAEIFFTITRVFVFPRILLLLSIIRTPDVNRGTEICPRFSVEVEYNSSERNVRS